jgi:hypothetical protein
VLAHVAGIPVEEALLAAPALLAGVTVIAGYVRATAARIRVKGRVRRGPRHQETTMPKYLLLTRRARAPARARRDLPAPLRHMPKPPAAPRTSPSATTWSGGPPALGPAELSEARLTERPPPKQRHPGPPPVSSTDSKERKIMDPQEVTEEPQDRTGSSVRRHDEYTPQELVGGRS